MQRRGTRTIRPARNPDGTERTVPTRGNDLTISQDNGESDDSGSYEPTASSQTPSLGDPVDDVPERRQLNFDSDLDFLDDRQRAMLMGNHNSDDDIQAAPSPPPAFRDMGSYMSEFAAHIDPCPVSHIALSLPPASDLINAMPIQGILPAEPLPEFAAEATEEDLRDEIQPEAPYEILEDLLDSEFGEQKAIFLSVGNLSATSGHHAILGARLLNQVAEHYGLGPSNTATVQGIEFSVNDVASWMGQRIKTIQNWQTRENRRVKLLNILSQLSGSDRCPRHDTMKRVLESLEGVRVDSGVKKLVDLDKYLARMEGRASTGL